ncbi:MAG: hypothetical protein F6K19_23835 [Cyanothece sp. SIO1E1]|nr:hypothetical protein [Cyanothece sp. SIO1E1]
MADLRAILNYGRQFYQFKQKPFVPVGFSVAAFRLGHSQVRNRFRVNASLEAKLFDLSFFDAVSKEMVVDASGFFQTNPTKQPQFSKKLDPIDRQYFVRSAHPNCGYR